VVIAPVDGKVALKVKEPSLAIVPAMVPGVPFAEIVPESVELD
jgi:hypothetical protein